MIWLDTYEDLQFYGFNSLGDCYCDLLVETQDLILQAPVERSPSGEYKVKIEVLAGDGIEVYEDATDYFEWFAFAGVSDDYYINMRSKRFSPSMCDHGCFVLRVQIWRVETFSIGEGGVTSERLIFDKYTERYCVDNCCEVPDNIDISFENTDGEYDILDYDNADYFAS
jgi:hypothetical protein